MLHPFHARNFLKIASTCSDIVYYVGAEAAGLNNGTGYATADLHLMTLDYSLFSDLAVKFCGNWISSQNSTNECPADGAYAFKVPYQLPPNTQITTWFATGWKGNANLLIRAARSNTSEVLSNCNLYFQTFTTLQASSRASKWKQLPSAFQAFLVVAALVALSAGCMCYMACCQRRRKTLDEAAKEGLHYNLYEGLTQEQRSKLARLAV